MKKIDQYCNTINFNFKISQMYNEITFPSYTEIH